MAIWDDSGTLMPPGHVSVQGHQAIRAYFEQLFKRSRFEFVFTSSQVSVDGALAVEHIVYSAATRSLEGGSTHRESGKGVHVYRREESGSWKLIMDVWNSDRPESKPTGDDSQPVADQTGVILCGFSSDAVFAFAADTHVQASALTVNATVEFSDANGNTGAVSSSFSCFGCWDY